MRLVMRKKVWLDARNPLKQHRAERTIWVTPAADAAPASRRLSYREVLRRAAAAVAAANPRNAVDSTERP